MELTAVREAYERLQAARIESFERAKASGHGSRWLDAYAGEVNASALAKMARFILFMCPNARPVTGFSQSQMSEVLRITRPYLSSTLNEWARRRIVCLAGREISILDRAALRAIVEAG